jgi:hypothetical protein
VLILNCVIWEVLYLRLPWELYLRISGEFGTSLLSPTCSQFPLFGSTPNWVGSLTCFCLRLSGCWRGAKNPEGAYNKYSREVLASLLMSASRLIYSYNPRNYALKIKTVQDPIHLCYNCGISATLYAQYMSRVDILNFEQREICYIYRLDVYKRSILWHFTSWMSGVRVVIAPVVVI